MNLELNYSEIRLDRSKPELLFIQLTGELQRLIGTGNGRIETTLISARKLAARLDINRMTVMKAYAELQKRHVIERESPHCYRVAVQQCRKNLFPYPNIGIILPTRFSELIDSASGMALQYIKGIIDSAAEKKLSTIMLELPSFSASAAEIEQFNEGLMKRLIGIVHIGGRGRFPDRPLEAVMKNEKLPQVIISAHSNMPNVGSVVCDPASGARALAEQLRALCHQKTGLMLYAANLDYTGRDCYFSYSGFRRPRIIRDIFLEYGLDCAEKYYCYGCSSYYAVLNALRKKKEEGFLPTVYWCHNDEVARWCIQALKDLGLSVPQDISVVGFDGAVSSREDDELTTISLPFYAIGRRAVLQLLDYYENGIEDSNRLAYLQTVLISRKTLAFARGEKLYS